MQSCIHVAQLQYSYLPLDGVACPGKRAERGGGARAHCATAGSLRNEAVHPGRRFPRSFFSSVLLWWSRASLACTIIAPTPSRGRIWATLDRPNSPLARDKYVTNKCTNDSLLEKCSWHRFSYIIARVSEMYENLDIMSSCSNCCAAV